VRVQPRMMEVTNTFKQRKFKYVAQGYDVAALSKSAPDDALYVRDDKQRTFVPLTAQMCRSIELGALRL
jgi:hypothetical protein